MNIEALYKIVAERMEQKKKNYSEQMERYLVLTSSENKTGCFERNMVNDLMVMMQTKAEISELSYIKTLLEAQMRNKTATETV